MATDSFRFDRYLLDAGDRRLSRDGAPVDLNARYLDALTLLVREQGKLVSKDRFHQEVWRGAPVTDEALTQCIKTLRRQLGDDAADPRFIETVPKHGYRFIAPVSPGPAALSPPREDQGPEPSGQPQPSPWNLFLRLGGAGTLGGGLTGVLVGVVYGFAAASHPLQPGIGAVSVLLVMICLSIGLGLIAGAGVAFGIAAGGFAPSRPGLWGIVGGAAGGLVVGGFGKLLGLDAFNLLFGQSPGDITGAGEGLLLGGALGLGAWLATRGERPFRLKRGLVTAGLAGAAAGVLAPLLGGRLMGGSLDLLARRFPDSRLRLDHIGALFGERGFGPISQLVTGALEGMVFGGCLVGAMMLARRSSQGIRPRSLFD